MPAPNTTNHMCLRPTRSGFPLAAILKRTYSGYCSIESNIQDKETVSAFIRMNLKSAILADKLRILHFVRMLNATYLFDIWRILTL